MTETLVAVLTRDRALADQVLAMTTTAGLVGEVLDDVDALVAAWNRARLVVIGTDQAERVADASPPRRRDVFLVGPEDDTTGLMLWSGPLGAIVVPLPSGGSALSRALSRPASEASSAGVVLCVIGGSGGVGASTLAVAAGLEAGRRSLSCALVDLDPLGGGLDLLMGVEHQAGWRWPQLSGVGGNVPDLGGELIDFEGLRLLSMGRWAPQRMPSATQLETVLDAAAREFDLTVVDLPRAALPGMMAAVRRSAVLIVVSRSDVRAFAATRQLLDAIPHPSRVGLVARGAGLDASSFADRLGVELVAVLRDERRVRAALDRGSAPGRDRRSRLARVAATCVDLAAAA